MRVEVEVCITGVDEALAASQAGADRLELCCWAECGGITPSMGQAVEVARAVDLPLRILIRPGPAGFRYSGHELAIMRLDAQAFSALPRLGGLVVGALDEADLPDRLFLENLRAAHAGQELTFHRAIDRSNDPLRALAFCRDAGMDRILTSGGRDRAMEGASTIARMVEGAEGLRIAAAGGIGPEEVVQLVDATGVQEVHFSARRPADDHAPEVALASGGQGQGLWTLPDTAKIERVLEALDRAGLR
ncbi:MAG: hypothetical protein H6595_12185 [Flavobacteriales bacterium]|nr:hypothetical protein [Flavobacteriales bacterium]MCB9168221.1 hypothetical protein [Flavobacteriales bacterium]